MSIRTYAISALVLGICLGTGAFAGPSQMRSLEDAQETSSDQIMFPSSEAGALFFKNCAICNRDTLQLTKSSRLFIGEQEVSLSVFKQALVAKNQRFLTIFYAPSDHLVTRVVMMPPTSP